MTIPDELMVEARKLLDCHDLEVIFSILLEAQKRGAKRENKECAKVACDLKYLSYTDGQQTAAWITSAIRKRLEERTIGA